MSEQKKSPKIEEVFNKHLTGESLKNGLDFVANMRSNGFTFKGSPQKGWTIDCNFWMIYFKNKFYAGDLTIDKKNHTFKVLCGFIGFEDAFQVDESGDLKEEILSYIMTCPQQNCKEPYCPSRKTNWKILDKSYGHVCQHPVQFFSADAKALEVAMKIMLLYKQFYAKDENKIGNEMEKWANSIIIKPDFPVRQGLSADYPVHFEKLCILLKEIYFDIAKNPESYGMNSPNKLYDFFSCLAKCGSIKNNQLFVCVSDFKKEAKKGQSTNSSPVTKYELIISKLIDFGFVFAEFNGKPFGKNVAAFTVEYPDNPQLLETIKQYCDYWGELWKDIVGKKGEYSFWNAYHHYAYRFYYLVAADPEKVTMQERFDDLAHYKGLPQSVIEFQKAFYEYSLRYSDIRYNEHYYYKSKMIIFDSTAWGHEPLLRMKIRKMTGYTSEIEKMPEAIRELFSKDHSGCKTCKEDCTYRVSWVFEGQQRKGCAGNFLTIDNFEDVSLIPHYWRLIELECKLKLKEKV